MPLSRDIETLKVPAFMRKRSIRTKRSTRPLILTALDRKKAGLPPEGLKKKRTARSILSRPTQKSPLYYLSEVMERRPVAEVRAPRSRRARAAARPVARPTFFEQPVRKTRKKKTRESFSAPLLDFYAQTKSEKPTFATQSFEAPIIEEAPVPVAKQKIIGSVTHYYDKIQVGVMKLKGTVCVGDMISYETLDGETYEQIVESMEIDRDPVFKAGKGKEVGLKLMRIPKIGCDVLK
ncbi:MAG: hypothetical protein AAB606_00330 [Patescibacteria group bacterium]